MRKLVCGVLISALFVLMGTARGELRVAFRNILIGEVWITAGQSNMAWAGARENIWEKEGLIPSGVRYTTHNDTWYRPKEDLSQRSAWLVCRDGALGRVSAIPYMFGKFVHRRLKVPVGIINVATGGSYGNNRASRDELKKIDLDVIRRMLSEADARVYFEQERWGMNRQTRQYEWKKDERPVVPPANDGMAHDGFAVAGKDRRWYPAKVAIDGGERMGIVRTVLAFLRALMGGKAAPAAENLAPRHQLA